jgi:hypothetical protein
MIILIIILKDTITIMTTELEKINVYLFDKYDKLVQANYTIFPLLIHNENDKSLNIIKLILKNSNLSSINIVKDDLYKLYEFFCKPSYMFNISKEAYFKQYLVPLIYNVYYSNEIFINTILIDIDKE